MTLKRHAILLVTGIIILVSLCLAFAKVTGCKDKAEAYDLGPHDSMTICDECPHIGWFDDETNEFMVKIDANSLSYKHTIVWEQN